MREPPVAKHHREILAPSAGVMSRVDNRRLGRVAKLAGAPLLPAAGVTVHARLGQRVAAGQPLYTVHAQSPGELEYATEYAAGHPQIMCVTLT